MVQKSNSSKQIKDLCASALDELKAKNINIFEVEKISSFASYILIGTGTSNRHIPVSYTHLTLPTTPYV